MPFHPGDRVPEQQGCRGRPWQPLFMGITGEAVAVANVVEVVIQWTQLRDSGYFGSVARDQWFTEQLQKAGVPMRQTAKGLSPDYSKGFLDVFYDDDPAQITMRWTHGFLRPECPVMQRRRDGFGQVRLTPAEKEVLAW